MKSETIPHDLLTELLPKVSSNKQSDDGPPTPPPSAPPDDPMPGVVESTPLQSLSPAHSKNHIVLENSSTTDEKLSFEDVHHYVAKATNYIDESESSQLSLAELVDDLHTNRPPNDAVNTNNLNNESIENRSKINSLPPNKVENGNHENDDDADLRAMDELAAQLPTTFDDQHPLDRIVAEENETVATTNTENDQRSSKTMDDIDSQDHLNRPNSNHALDLQRPTHSQHNFQHDHHLGHHTQHSMSMLLDQNPVQKNNEFEMMQHQSQQHMSVHQQPHNSNETETSHLHQQHHLQEQHQRLQVHHHQQQQQQYHMQQQLENMQTQQQVDQQERNMMANEHNLSQQQNVHHQNMMHHQMHHQMLDHHHQQFQSQHIQQQHHGILLDPQQQHHQMHHPYKM